MSDRPMMSTRLLDHDDGRCRRLRRRRCTFSDKRQTLAILVALALLAQQTSGVGGELAAGANRKSRKRQSAVVDEFLPLSTVEDDPYETDAQTHSNWTSNGRTSASRHQFEFVNPKPGRLIVLCYCNRYNVDKLHSVTICAGSCYNVCRLHTHARINAPLSYTARSMTFWSKQYHSSIRML